MESYNRVGADWERWQEEERKLEKLVPGTLQRNRPFLKEKLALFNELEAKYSQTLTSQERRTLIALKTEREKLVRTLYPNPMLRLLFKLFTPYQKQQASRQFQRVALDNEQRITATLARTGFGEANSQAMLLMKQGRESFSIPVSSYIGEREKVDYTLSFVKNQYDQYELDHYKTSYTNGTEKRVHNFYPDQNVSASQAYHLMAGRALINDNPEIPWKTEQWVQLDFNDKDAVGNYRIKILNKDESYNLEGLLSMAGVKGDLLRISQNLKNGEQVEVTLKGSKYLLEANPHHKTLNVCDEAGNKQSIERVLSDRKQTGKVIALHPEDNKTKQNKGKRIH